jgi:uncharacterized protein DUF5985
MRILSMLSMSMLSGAMLMGYALSGLFFLRFWRLTRDRLFLIFALSFWVLGVQRFLVGLSGYETRTYLYAIRLVAYLLILWAIVDKNRRGTADVGR